MVWRRNGGQGQRNAHSEDKDRLYYVQVGGGILHPTGCTGGAYKLSFLRIRRLKCDEQRPSCQRCVQNGVTCDGYLSKSLSRAKLISATKDQAAAGFRGPLVQFLNRQSLTGRENIGATEGQDDARGRSISASSGESPAASSSMTLSRVPSIQGINMDESHFFDYVRTRTLPMTGSFLKSHFWTQFVLQLAHDEPAIRHSILALGALHRRFEETIAPIQSTVEKEMAGLQIDEGFATAPDMNFSSKNRDRLARREALAKFAEKQYMKAVAAARSLIEKNSTIEVLTACIIFICYENMVGRLNVANLHRKSGERILEQMKQRSRIPGLTTGDEPRTMSNPFCAIQEIFSRIDFQAMTLTDDRYPYEVSVPGVLNMESVSPLQIPFANLDQAWAQMMDDARNLYKIMETWHLYQKISQEEFERLIEVSMGNFCHWEMVLESMRTGLRNAHDIGRHAMLEMYYVTLRLIAENGAPGPETRWDKEVHRFERIIDLAEILTRAFMETEIALAGPAGASPASAAAYEGMPRTAFFSLEPGIIIPLFITIHHCRKPIVRRKALSLLRSCWRVEGIWDSIGAATVAEWVIDTEEEGMGVDAMAEVVGLEHVEASVVKEEKRIHMIFCSLKSEKREVHIKCLLQPNGPEGEIETKARLFYW